MTLLVILSWASTVAVLGTYALSVRHPSWFDWANALGFPFVLAVQLIAGVYAPATLTLFFGIIGIWNLIKRKRKAEYQFYKTSTHGPVQEALWNTRDMGYLHKAYAALEAAGVPKDCNGPDDCR